MLSNYIHGEMPRRAIGLVSLFEGLLAGFGVTG